MADYYTQTSFTVPVKTEEEREWLNATLTSPPDELRMGHMEDSEDLVLEFSWDMQDESLWIYAEENCNTEQIAAFLKLYLQQEFCDHEALGFQYSYTCSKMRSDGFGGGAVRMRKYSSDPDGVWRENFDTNFFLEEWSIP